MSNKDTWLPKTSPYDHGVQPGQAPLVVSTDDHRYNRILTLASGGMGEVYRVRDLQLHRSLAMKVLRPEFKDNAAAVARFVEEAQATAQLQHPGIVPVHELGVDDSGIPWFTMREVRGHTLQEILQEQESSDDHPWTLRRLVDVLHQVCQTVAYAHFRGVIHRDLKPDNLLVGDFGQVFVVDWGLAKVLGTEALEHDEPIHTNRSADKSLVTQHGQVAGTPGFMAPEQWAGKLDAFGPHTDVYALGCVLSKMLTGHTTPDGRPTARHPDLMAIARKATAQDPAQRYPDASAIATELERWLDGERRTDAARVLVAESRRPGSRARELARKAADLQAQAEALSDQLDAMAPLEEKRALWHLQDAVVQTKRQQALKEVDEVQMLRAALVRAPGLPEAREGLADHYHRQHRAAEARRDPASAARYEALLMAYDTGRHRGYLQGLGRVSLETIPPAAEIEAIRVKEQDRTLQDSGHTMLGPSPIIDAQLPIGSWSLAIRAKGCPEVRYPVRIGREQPFDARPPGQDHQGPIVLPLRLDEDDIFVPAGWTVMGGDEEAIGSLPRRRVWVDAFIIRRFHVTAQEYVAFLNDIGHRADQHATENALWTHKARGWTLAPRANGRQPATFVNAHDADVFCEWWASATGLPWRLPNEAEWEKAARGVDERVFPFGNHLDPTFCCYQSSHGRAAPSARSVDRFPMDVSPYGVRGMGGMASEWVADEYVRFGPDLKNGRWPTQHMSDDPGAVRVQRGGSWGLHKGMVRSAGRWWQNFDSRSNMVSFRMARSLVEEDVRC